MPASKKNEQPDIEEAPGEFPVMGYEPLQVPKGFTIADLMARIEALEAAASKPAAKK